MDLTEPRKRVRIERGHKWVRTFLAGELVASTKQPLLVWEVPYYPVYYFSLQDVIAHLLPTGEAVHSPSRGDAEVCDVSVTRATATGAAHRRISSPVSELRGTVRFHWSAMDLWFEEEEPVRTHARDPYTRIDILTSSRHVEVRVDDVTVAETHQPHLLFETGLPVRYYLPLCHVRQELLVPSSTETHCPYKGRATYWSLEIGGRRLDYVLWTYPTPLPESQKIAGYACFFSERVDLLVDGSLEPRPHTRFS